MKAGWIADSLIQDPFAGCHISKSLENKGFKYICSDDDHGGYGDGVIAKGKHLQLKWLHNMKWISNVFGTNMKSRIYSLFFKRV
jgi:hypothetical protein